MSTSSNPISDTVNVSGIKVSVQKKKIKNFHLNVLPPKGKVRVSVPLDTDDDTVYFFIASRLPWIRKKSKAFRKQKREPRREFVNRESHYYFGKRYLLRVLQSEKNYVKLTKKKYIDLHVKDKNDRDKKMKTVETWYRQNLKKELKSLINKWAEVLDVQPTHWSIRKMKTKWGSCNTAKQRLLFNLKLAKKTPKTIDYIVLHEMIHLKERKHNERFVAILDEYMPTWRTRRKELNDFILSYT